MQEFEVEVRRTFRVKVRVRAKNSLSAAKYVDSTDYPMPSFSTWEPDGGWTYVVTDPATGARLYRGDAQELT